MSKLFKTTKNSKRIKNKTLQHGRQKTPIDYTALWTTYSQRLPRFNRMDPDTEAESDPSPERSRPSTKKGKKGEIQVVLTRDDWKRFYAERLRKLVDVPDLTNKELTDIFERNRRIYFKNKKQQENDIQLVFDEDLPTCFYWDKFQVADWATSVGLSDTVKSVTKAVREVLGLPQTNGVRAVARFIPLEAFLKMKARTGSEMNMQTFKEFCEIEGIEYEAARRQMLEKYRPLPGRCQVVIKPWKYEKVKWIPVERHDFKPPDQEASQDDYENYDSTSSSESDWLQSAPTVEELVNNVLVRNSVIPQIMNDIIEAVFKKISDDRKSLMDKRKAQLAAEQVVKTRMEQAYLDFSISNPQDKLKFVTIIAEELVDDILRAREVLEDIDKFQERIQRELPKHELENYQAAVAHYVQNIMPAVVSAALKEMEDSSVGLQDQLDVNNLSEEEHDE
ncbi:unnamed protein product [Orchesella dallaii]|uniref:Uncharacterized protein n=1 Tax=Orchesella dallaii TaxID=48710 RepID=A0ABP1PKY7_9HEXA